MQTVTKRNVRLILLAACVLLLISAAMPILASGSGLPDNRAYELVSTSGTAGEPYQPTTPFDSEGSHVLVTEHVFEAAEDGESVSYVGEPPIVGGLGESGPGEGDQWLATRTSQGWQTVAITPALKSSEYPAYQAFSNDLSTAYFIGGREPLAPGVPQECRSLYARASDSGAYRAVFTPSEAPAGETVLGPCGHPLFTGADENASQVIFQSEAALTANAQASTELPPGRQAHSELGGESGEPCAFDCDLYDSVGGHLRLVNEVEGRVVPDATFGGYPGEKGYTDFSNTISTDGSRIFWTDTQTGPDFEHVYVLENGTSTVAVSGADPAEYWTATPDGRYALYTENEELWRFDTDTNTRELLAGAGAGVQGVVAANQTGEDGAYLYFVADGALASNENTNGETAKKGEEEGLPNLYLRHEGATSFIATLSPQDNHILASSVFTQTAGDWKASLGERTAEATPDGRYLVFQSVRPLTGYDNTTPAGGSSVEVFVYSADDAQLICASCDPTGTPPVVEEQNSETRLPESLSSNIYIRRWMSDNGNRVFFDSEQPLVPQDTNGVQDVYEWEREGTPISSGSTESSCPTQSPARPNHGCVFLLSGADNQDFSFLVDADATGDNVFLEHWGPLGSVEAPVDYNELYDLRVDGGFQHSALACTGTGCQGVPPAPPLFATPASVTFSGIGNFPAQVPAKAVVKRAIPANRTRKRAEALKVCRKGDGSRRGQRERCERRARQRYGTAAGNAAAKAGRTSNERRSQR
jgi:hypothetical protein